MDRQNQFGRIMQKHDLVREALINAARRIFSRFGFEKTTMNEIAMEARKGKSSLYYYFAGKEEVFNAVVEYEAEILKEKLIEIVGSETNTVDKLRLYVVTRFKGIKELGNLYNAMRNDLLSHLDFIQKARHKYDEEEMTFIHDLLKQGNEESIFDIKDTQSTSQVILMTIKAVELPLLLDYETSIFEEKLNSLLDIFFNGLKKR